jgi:hypothetical protein
MKLPPDVAKVRDEERPILKGYMALEDYADDYSDWSGHITGPSDPTGANLHWLDPIPMIEQRAYDELQKRYTLAAERYARLVAALRLIAAPKRSDGTYNRSREACEELARKALAEIGDKE